MNERARQFVACGALTLASLLSACGGGGGGVSESGKQPESIVGDGDSNSALPPDDAGDATDTADTEPLNPKADALPPTITSFGASADALSAPGTIRLWAEASDPESGVFKVEFYETGTGTPIDILFSPPYRTAVDLGPQDNGEHSYFVKVYDAALDSAGAVVPNIASNQSGAIKIVVAIPENTLERAGSLKSELGYRAHGTTLAISADPFSNTRFFANHRNLGAAGGVLVADFSAKTIEQMDGSGFFQSVVADPLRPDRLVAHEMMGSIMESIDAGRNWSKISSGFLGGPMNPNARYLEYSPTGNVLYAFTSEGFSSSSGGSGSFFYSLDGGSTWGTPESGISSYEATGPIAVSATDGNTVYALVGSAVLKSSDAGRNFVPIATQPFPTIFAVNLARSIAVDPFDANHLLVAGPPTETYTPSFPGYPLYQTLDGGVTWSRLELPTLPVASGIAGSFGGPFGRISFNRSVRGLVYIPLGAGTQTASVLRSQDGGKSWKLLTFHEPTARGDLPSAPPQTFISTAPDANGAVALLIPAATSDDGVWHYIDREAAK